MDETNTETTEEQKLSFGAGLTSLNYLTLSFKDQELQRKYDAFNSSQKDSRTALILLYIFVVLSTYQYSGVGMEALKGHYGTAIATSFYFWIVGFFSYTFLLVLVLMDVVSEYSEGSEGISGYVAGNNKEGRARVQAWCVAVFVLAQPMVHGFLIYGRTVSPRECRPYAEASGIAGVLEIMEVQMTCNTSIVEGAHSGRIPCELTSCMGLFMIFHQNMFCTISWGVVAMHWLIGFVLLLIAYINVVSYVISGVGEALLVLICFVGLFAIMSNLERGKKELFLLKLRYHSSECDHLDSLAPEGGHNNRYSDGTAPITRDRNLAAGDKHSGLTPATCSGEGKMMTPPHSRDQYQTVTLRPFSHSHANVKTCVIACKKSEFQEENFSEVGWGSG